mmetsp:Transcript_23997/g.44010  ORF Transcript_23997/g.44010 Transcript_23997/m.44010 type:complete len:124 (+) Transcript_23997:386-757(+)
MGNLTSSPLAQMVCQGARAQMQILEPGQTDRPRCDAGMTLIELLVVVTVVSILTVGVAIVMGRGPSAPAARDTAQFLEAWRLQSDLARQSHVPTALRVDPTGWHSMRLGGGGGGGAPPPLPEA